MPTVTRKPGDFCWINMLTPEPTEARKFFGELLGWNYIEMPGIGHLVQVGGHNVGGLFDLESPQTPPGTKPKIGVMIKVANADATCAKVTSLGGKAKPAFEVMGQGRMAVCYDPNGGEFDIWEPIKMLGTDVDPTDHGAPTWFETLTTDVDRASIFYKALFGWTSEVNSVSGFSYTTFMLDNHPVAGLMALTPEMGNLPAHWGTYFTVRNADETASQAIKLGATLCVPVRDIPGIGRFCGIISPQGVTFYVIQYL